jgi:hypothetical protein
MLGAENTDMDDPICDVNRNREIGALEATLECGHPVDVDAWPKCPECEEAKK